MVKMYRQGDLLFVEARGKPRGNYVERRHNGIILRGEETGHAHRLIGGDVYSEQWGPDIYLEVGAGAVVVHEEHGDIELGEGFWRVIRQREYSGGKDETRYIID